MTAWDDAFRASYGASLDDVVEAYLATADCAPDIAPFPNFACQAPTLLAEEGAIRFEHTLECSDPEVEGGLRPDYLDQPLGRWGTWITRAIEIPTTGDYDIRVDLPAVESGLFNYARLQRCDGCTWLDEELLPLPSGTTERHTLAAGRYALTLFNFNPDGGQGSFTLTPAD